MTAPRIQWLALALLALVARPVLGIPSMLVWTATPLQKIKATDAPGSNTSVAIKAARNEYESFQIIVTAQGGVVSIVDATISDFSDSNGNGIPKEQVTIYREGFLNIRRISDIRGTKGLWPDILYPKVDPYFGEVRKAFPVRVLRKRNQPLWFDVYVPRGTPAGTYTATVSITSKVGIATVPVTLTVWNFTLPAKQTLESVIGFDEFEAMREHDPRHRFDYDYARILPELTGPYLVAHVRNRIGIDYDSQDGTDSAFSSWIHPPTFDWTQFDATVGAALDGTLFGANGNQLRNITLPDIDPAGTNDFWNDTEKKQIWSAFADHFTAHGWFDRLVDYPGMADEPDVTTFPDIQAHANLLHQANPALRLISTTAIKLPNDATPDNIYDQIDSPLIGFLNVWVPIVEFFAVKNPLVCSSPDREVPRVDYDSRITAGDQVWQYQSCNSHECGSIGNDCVLNYPTYMVDVPALHNRIFEWMSWHERVTGELYFESNYAYQAHVTPYQTIYYFGGNGDGTLFYPGTPSRIGGTHHIPIESLRLKQIRDGMEDFEFMALLRSLGQQAFADAQVNAIVTNVYTFNQDPAALLAAREAMGDLLSSLAP